MDTFEIYGFPERVAEITLPLGEARHSLKRAIVKGKADGDFEFAATVSFNRGQLLRVFHSLDEARDWLCAE